MTEKACNYQNNKWTSHENKVVEPVQLVQLNMYQSNTYRKDLNCLWAMGFNRDSKCWTSSSITIAVAYLTYPCTS